MSYERRRKHEEIMEHLLETNTTYIYEVDEVGILRVYHIGEVFSAGDAHFSLAIRHDNGPVVLIKENLAPCSAGQD